ncbi:hypothetical protein SDC9_104596 [bioreactor metagenome]|uniref:Uncharacterized protein n=1 Tax=bioreactor metagenome TaxID=1076179 RepID=A0A645B3P3_9ZZZZ
MGKMIIDEQLSSAAAAIYSTNSLFARFKIEADLDPEDGNPYPLALPTHVHEFVHYLHNISTAAGVQIIFLMHTLVFMGAQYLIEHGRGVGRSSKESDQKGDFKFFIDRLNFIFGDFERLDQDVNNKQGWKFSNLRSYEDKCPAGLFAYQVDVFGKVNNESVNGILRIGLNFLTEGVAYEVERELWRKREIDVSLIDAQTPIFPYLAYQPLVNYLVGRETTPMERIEIGDVALLRSSPSQGFVEACLALRKGRTQFDNHLKNRVDGFKRYIENDFDSEVGLLREFYSATDRLLKPFMNYMSVVKSAALKRVDYPILEELFTKEKIDEEKFFAITSSIAEHCVIQEKYSGSVTIDLVGHPSGMTSFPNDDIQWFYILCSAIHFVQQHLTSDGAIAETDKLREKSCPFSGGCEVEKGENYPVICRKYPWKFKREINVEEKGLCWYMAGIRSITPELKSAV